MVRAECEGWAGGVQYLLRRPNDFSVVEPWEGQGPPAPSAAATCVAKGLATKTEPGVVLISTKPTT